MKHRNDNTGGNSNQPPHDWYTIEEAAIRIKVGNATIRNLLTNGLPYSQPTPKIIRILSTDLDQFLMKHRKNCVPTDISRIADEILKDLGPDKDNDKD